MREKTIVGILLIGALGAGAIPFCQQRARAVEARGTRMMKVTGGYMMSGVPDELIRFESNDAICFAFGKGLSCYPRTK